jgi:topoisomerase-4 subunit B
MYTDTSRPNQLAQEVIDNSVDEALAGHAKRIDVVLFADGSCQVSDDGRGIPVDIHPKLKISAVELILTRPHWDATFSNDACGTSGVGVAVVNALSKKLEVRVCRGGSEYAIGFADGELAPKLKEVGNVPKNRTGTTLRFWPNEKYFDSPMFSIPHLNQVLRAKAALCPNLRVSLDDQINGKQVVWQYERGLTDYLKDMLNDAETVPTEPLVGKFVAKSEQAEWALLWLNDVGEVVAESYVNLIPTLQGGTHVNGLRDGLTVAIREFCEFRNLLPPGLKLTPEDVWQGCSHVLSVKMVEPQFASQTKERLSSSEIATFVQGVVRDSFGLWLNQHPEAGEHVAALVISNANARLNSRPPK